MIFRNPNLTNESVSKNYKVSSKCFSKWKPYHKNLEWDDIIEKINEYWATKFGCYYNWWFRWLRIYSTITVALNLVGLKAFNLDF
jgi:hypothetical protein